MKPADNIEKLIKNIDIDTNAKMDKAVLDDVLKALEKSKREKSALIAPNVWRIIMKSRITKFAAAAVIAIAVLIGIHEFGGSIDLATPTFADVVEAVGNVPWMHMVGKTERYEFEHWISVPTQTVAKVRHYKNKRFRITWSDFASRERRDYDSESNVLDIGYEYRDFGSNGDEYDPMNYLRSIISPEVKKFSTITCIEEKYQQQEVKVYNLIYDEEGRRCDIEVITDISSNLPVFIKYKYQASDGRPPAIMEGPCNYPAKGPKDIYDLGARRDAEIVNYMPSDETRKVIELCRKHRKSFVEKNKDYILMFVRDSDRGREIRVQVLYKRANLKRCDVYYTQRQPIRLNESNFIKWVNSHKPFRTHFYDGKYWHDFDHDKKKYNRGTTYGRDEYLADRGWRVAYNYNTLGRKVENEYSKKNHLICLEFAKSDDDNSKRWRFYINPEYDYICQRYEEYWPKEKEWAIEEVKEYARTESGQWYPKTIDYQGSIETIYLQLKPKFPEGILDLENLPKYPSSN